MFLGRAVPEHRQSPHVLVVDTVEVVRHGFEIVIRDTLTFVRVAPFDVKSRVQLRQNGELSRSDIRRLNEEVLFDTTHVCCTIQSRARSYRQALSKRERGTERLFTRAG